MHIYKCRGGRSDGGRGRSDGGRGRGKGSGEKMSWQLERKRRLSQLLTHAESVTEEEEEGGRSEKLASRGETEREGRVNDLERKRKTRRRRKRKRRKRKGRGGRGWKDQTDEPNSRVPSFQLVLMANRKPTAPGQRPPGQRVRIAGVGSSQHRWKYATHTHTDKITE